MLVPQVQPGAGCGSAVPGLQAEEPCLCEGVLSRLPAEAEGGHPGGHLASSGSPGFQDLDLDLDLDMNLG